MGAPFGKRGGGGLLSEPPTPRGGGGLGGGHSYPGTSGGFSKCCSLLWVP